MPRHWTLSRRSFFRRSALAAACGLPMLVRSDSLRASPVAASRSRVRVASVDDESAFAPVRAMFDDDHPGIKLTLADVDGPCELTSQQGGMRVFWIYRGRGEVFLGKGYRTQEGDGTRLPDDYRPDPIEPAFLDLLKVIQSGAGTVTAKAETPVKAILGRWKGDAFTGDFAGDLWKLVQIPRPWSTDRRVEESLAALMSVYRRQGFSTKQADSWEPLQEGDQVIACPGAAVKVRGRFRALAMENTARAASHVSAVRRLRYLVDSAGGCNPDFAPFRRLPLTWQVNYPGETGDGPNWVNSHVVNIPKETSPSHFHPPKAAAGSRPQSEMYLVLDPKTYRLNTWGRQASILLWPDLRDLGRFEQHALVPGTFVYIPPGTGHRGLDAFVNVLTVPGFKPDNEFYIDRDLRDLGRGSPYNAKLLEIKNYRQIEDLL
jgi:hypothetical protein